jgi:hypothetical protein
MRLWRLERRHGIQLLLRESFKRSIKLLDQKVWVILDRIGKIAEMNQDDQVRRVESFAQNCQLLDGNCFSRACTHGDANALAGSIREEFESRCRFAPMTRILSRTKA